MRIEESVTWPTCDQEGCIGIRLDAGGSCLAHAEDEQRDAALKQISETGKVDVRGVTISVALLGKILSSTPRGPGAIRRSRKPGSTGRPSRAGPGSPGRPSKAGPSSTG